MRRAERLILIWMCLSLAAVVSAVSALNVALPDLARATGASTTELPGSSTPYREVSVPADRGEALSALGSSANASAFPSGSGTFTWRTPFE